MNMITANYRPSGLLFAVVLAMLFGVPTQLYAVNTLQVGAPGGPGEGTYADYVPNSTFPTEEDTAFTSGNTVLVAGVYNNNVLNLGGLYAGGKDWSAVDSNLGIFDGVTGAILVAAIPDGTLPTDLSTTLLVNGQQAIHSSAELSGLFPNNHDPLKDDVSDFLFFDIGSFQPNADFNIPNFDDELAGTKDGEIKSLTISQTAGLDWIHFDVIALETFDTPKGNETLLRTTLENNPGSHDLTWKPSVGTNPPVVPEPTSLAVWGLGLAVVGIRHRRRRRRKLPPVR